MNKATLIDKIARDAGITKTAAATAIESLVDGVTGALKKNQRVTLVGAGRNPQTGETIRIKAKKSVRFKPGKQLEATLNK